MTDQPTEEQITRFATLMDRLHAFDLCAAGGPLHVIVDDCNVGIDPDRMVLYRDVIRLSTGAQWCVFEIVGFLSAFDEYRQECLVETYWEVRHTSGIHRRLPKDDPRTPYADGGLWVNGGES